MTTATTVKTPTEHGARNVFAAKPQEIDSSMRKDRQQGYNVRTKPTWLHRRKSRKQSGRPRETEISGAVPDVYFNRRNVLQRHTHCTHFLPLKPEQAWESSELQKVPHQNQG